jgi:DNA-binding response OmpR family regulator
MDHSAKVNFNASSILLVEQSTHSLDVLCQIFLGFGARNLHRATSNAQAEGVAARSTIDLVIIDPNLKECDGHDFIKWMRRNGSDANRGAPIIVVSANGSKNAIARARNSGANFFVLKPLTPTSLLDRITWVARDGRPFFEGESYCGPDRRFKFEGPPPGMDPRRASDAQGDLGDASAPNMSQS